MMMATYGGHQPTVKWLVSVGAVLDETALEAARKGLAQMALGGEAEATHRERTNVKDGSQAKLLRKLERKCAECGKVPAGTMCGGCRTAFYCKRECQTANWAKHRKECSGLFYDIKAGCSK